MHKGRMALQSMDSRIISSIELFTVSKGGQLFSLYIFRTLELKWMEVHYGLKGKDTQNHFSESQTLLNDVRSSIFFKGKTIPVGMACT